VYSTRLERTEDHDAVRELHDRVFGRPDEGRLGDAVRRRSDPSFCLVAVLDEASPRPSSIVGHVLFSPVRLEPGPAAPAVGVGPMAVDPAHQRAGVGSMLVERGLDRCREEGYGLAFLLGPPHYYERFGFTMARDHGIHWSHEVPGDPFMVCELRPGALGGAPSVAYYLPEFLTL